MVMSLNQRSSDSSGRQNESKMSQSDVYLMKISKSILKDLSGWGWSPVERVVFRKRLLAMIKQCNCQFLLKDTLVLLNSSDERPSAGRDAVLFTPQRNRRRNQGESIRNPSSSAQSEAFQPDLFTPSGARGSVRRPAGRPAQGVEQPPRNLHLEEEELGQRGQPLEDLARNIEEPAGQPLVDVEGDEADVPSRAPTRVEALQQALLDTQNQFREALVAITSEQKAVQANYARLNSRVDDGFGHRNKAGCESWVAENQIIEDLRVDVTWFNPSQNRDESAAELAWRVAFWQALIRELPNTIFAQVEEHDVRAVYARLIMYNQQTSVKQISRLNARLGAMLKGTTPMTEYLEELYTLTKELEILDQPAPESQVMQVVRTSLEADVRYRPALEELNRNPRWSMDMWRITLEGYATELHDLCSTTIKHKGAAPAAAPAVPRVRRADASQTDEGPTFDQSCRWATEMETATRALGAAQRRVNAVQLAHPTPPAGAAAPGGAGRPAKGPKAERAPITDEKLAELASEVCTRHLAGRCPWGDTCRRKHLDGSEAAKWLSSNDAGKPPRAKDDLSCWSWTNKGECVFGPKCKFQHPAKAHGNVAVLQAPATKGSCWAWGQGECVFGATCKLQHPMPLRAYMATREEKSAVYSPSRDFALSELVAEWAIPAADVEEGDVAVIPGDAHVPRSLRGELAQIFAIAGSYARMVTQAEQGVGITAASKTYITNLREIGLVRGTYIAVPTRVADKVIQLQRCEPKPGFDTGVSVFTTGHANAFDRLRGKPTPAQPISIGGAPRHGLNAAFDTGANVFLTGHAHVFDRLRPCAPGSGTVKSAHGTFTCTHWGMVTMVASGVYRTFKGFFTSDAPTVTLVPASWWDTQPDSHGCHFSFRGVGQALELWQHEDGTDALLGRYPREVYDDIDLVPYSRAFMGDVRPADDGSGRLLHVLYPLPDTCFVMSGGAQAAAATAHTPVLPPTNVPGGAGEPPAYPGKVLRCFSRLRGSQAPLQPAIAHPSEDPTDESFSVDLQDVNELLENLSATDQDAIASILEPYRLPNLSLSSSISALPGGEIDSEGESAPLQIECNPLPLLLHGPGGKGSTQKGAAPTNQSPPTFPDQAKVFDRARLAPKIPEINRALCARGPSNYWDPGTTLPPLSGSHL